MSNEETLCETPATLLWVEQHTWGIDLFWVDLLRYINEKARLYTQGYTFSKELNARLLGVVGDGALPLIGLYQGDIEKSCLKHVGPGVKSGLLCTMNELQAQGISRQQPFHWDAVLVQQLMLGGITPWEWLSRWTEMVSHQYQAPSALTEMLVSFLQTSGAQQISWAARVHTDPYLEVVALWAAIEHHDGTSKYHFRGSTESDVIIDTYAKRYSPYWPIIKMMNLPFADAYQILKMSKTTAADLPQELMY